MNITNEEKEILETGGYSYYTLPEVDDYKITLRLLPPWKGYNVPGLLVLTHKNKRTGKTYRCEKTHRETCPMCLKIKAVKAEDRYTLENRVYFNAVMIKNNVDSSANIVEPIVLITEKFIFDEVIKKAVFFEYKKLTDCTNGHDLIIKSTDGKISITVNPKEYTLPLSESGIESLLEKTASLHKLFKYPNSTDMDHFKKAVSKIKG